MPPRLSSPIVEASSAALVIDTTSSAASLPLETAAQREVPVAYVTGLAMRRAADLYAGAAKTDPKEAVAFADYARRNADRLSWTTPSDELLARLRILNGRDADLAADATRAANRLRDALLAVSPALERALGARSPPAAAHATPWPAGALPQHCEPPGAPAYAPASPNARPAQRAGSPTRSGPRSTRRASPSPPRPPGATPSPSSPPTWTASASAATSSPATSRKRSWTIRWEKSSTACAGSAREPAPEPSLRSATPTDSPTAAASPPTPGSPPSTGNQGAALWPANPEAATTASARPRPSHHRGPRHLLRQVDR